MSDPASEERDLLRGLGPSVATGLGLGLVLPLAGLGRERAGTAATLADLGARAREIGAHHAAAEAARSTRLAVSVLWPHPPARFSAFALPDWSVAVITPGHPACANDPTAFLGKSLIGKAAATFAARAVATTEALRRGDIDLLSFALDDAPLADLLGAAIPGLQPALLAARSAGATAGLSRWNGKLSIAAIHPEAALTAAAASAAAERLFAHSLACEVTQTRFARSQPEPLS